MLTTRSMRSPATVRSSLRAPVALTADGLASHNGEQCRAAASPVRSGCGSVLTLGMSAVDRRPVRPAGTRARVGRARHPLGPGAGRRDAARLRRPRPLDDTVLDHAFTDLERDDEGLTRVRLESPRAARR